MADRLLDLFRALRTKVGAASSPKKPQKAPEPESEEAPDIVEVKTRVRRLARSLGYSSIEEAAQDLGVDFDGSPEAWQELLAALEEASREQVEQEGQLS